MENQEEEIETRGAQESASVVEVNVILPSTHHVDVGPAVLKKYFEVVDQLKKSEFENSILRSEIDFAIHFIERMTDIKKSTEMQVLVN